jgi:hypothetical protein
MKRLKQCLTTALLLLGAMHGARADFELTDDQGRTILLKDDGTWSYVDAKAPAKLRRDQRAELQLVRKAEVPGGCRFDLTLTNKLPYEITSLVPDFSVYRADNVVYATQLLGFGSLKPGDRLNRSLQFEGLGCADITRLQVHGADRCEMGELNKFSDAKGRCLALMRVLPSDALKFNK